MEQQSPNERRLEDWMRTYGTAILRTCFVILSDAREAEDAMQDTFLRAWRERQNVADAHCHQCLPRLSAETVVSAHRHAARAGRLAAGHDDRAARGSGIDAGHPALARRPQKPVDSLLLSGYEPSGNRRCTGHQQIDSTYAAQKSGTGAQTFADRR